MPSPGRQTAAGSVSRKVQKGVAPHLQMEYSYSRKAGNEAPRRHQMFSIRYNRATNHISGIECKTQGPANDRSAETGVVAYYAENACGVLTRGRLAQGKSYEDLQEALEAARTTGGRKVCKTCEKAALAALEAIAEAAANAPVEEPATETVEGAEHQVGDVLYFLPGQRPHGYVCPAGEVEVVRVVDHGEPTPYS